MHKTLTQKLRNWTLRASFLALPVAYVLFSSNSGGITGRSTIGCSGGGCHSSNSAATMLTITGIPGTGWTPGQAYPITVTVANGSQAAAGFDLSVTAGTISNAGAGATIVGGNMEIRHNSPKSMSSGSASWTFTWTAPASGTSVNFNFAGNAVNLNGGTSGDAPNQTTITYNAAAVVRPAATTDPATAITASSATLNGTANAEGNNGVTATFEYGPTSALGSTTAAAPSSITGTTPTAVTGSLTGLMPNTTYFYRLVLNSGLGTDAGSIMSFTTSAATSVPVFGMSSSMGITTNTAMVHDTITPNASAIFGVKYGTTTAMTQTAATTPVGGFGTTAIPVSANLSGLMPNTKYYFAFTATVNGNTTSAAMDSFTTMPMSVTNVAPERIVVYPNPAQTTLEWALPAGVKVQNAYAFTLNGQRTALTFAQSGNTSKADVSTLAPGIYYLLLDGGTKTYMAPFQKN